MVQPLLPPLKQDDEGNQIGEIVAGSWGTEKQADLLEHIGDALNIPDLEDHNYKVNSIPNMWARPLLFEMVLTENHPMHQQILGEWRGLLAMLALKERRNFPLTTTKVTIPRNDDENQPDFLRALSRLFPNKTLDTEEATWETLYLILFNGKPIGLTSPTTLVCTSVNYADKMSRESVPWYENGKHLKDPVEDLDEEERIVVAAWLHKIWESIKPNDTTRELCGVIRGLLRGFIEELIDDASIQDCEFSDNSDDNFKLEGFFSCMDEPVLSLKGQKEYFTEDLLVINEENAFKGCLPPNIINSDALLGSHDIKITPILPIRKEKLSEIYKSEIVGKENEIDGELLNDKIHFENVQGGIKVSLEFPASDSNGQEEVSIFKIYRFSEKQQEDTNHTGKNSEIVELDNLPVLEIWPNFKKEGWKAYYTYFGRLDESIAFYAEPFLPEGRESKSTGDKINKITRTPIFPEVMLCQHKKKGQQEEKDIGVLLIQVETCPETNPDSEWTVGIDFGTTSTAVYRKANDGTSEPIELKNRVIQVPNYDDDVRLPVYQNFFYPDGRKTPFFSTLHIGDLHFKSENSNGTDALLNGNIYFLRFLGENADGNFSEFNELRKNGKVHTDLKWSPADENDENNNNMENTEKRRLQIFLRQLCLQCAAEAAVHGVRSIKWRYSYPKAFSGDDILVFNRTWHGVTENCMALTPLVNTGLESEAESIVIAKYFKSPSTDGYFTSGAVCIDIGGATSDISIWQGEGYGLRSQTSLKLAGRDIFLDLLVSNPLFLKEYAFGKEEGELQKVPDAIKNTIEEVANEKDDTSQKYLSQKYLWADTLLEDYGKYWLEDFTGGKYLGSPGGGFRRLIAIGIAGLLYYVGLLLKYLSEKNQIDIDQKDQEIYIYFGGRGSRIFDWFGGDKDREGETEFLEKVFLDAINPDRQGNLPEFKFVFTSKPKEEAAAGLVSNDDRDVLNNDVEDNLILAGESFEAAGTKHEWTALLTDDLLKQELKLESLEQFQKFIDSFNKHVEPAKRMSNEKRFKLPAKIEPSLSTLHSAVLEGIDSMKISSHIEPLFTLALKGLLKEETKKWIKP